MKKILLAFFVLMSFTATSQVLQKPSVYGYEFRRMVIDTLFAMPSDTFTVPAALVNFPFVARKGAVLYYWNGTAWVAFSGSSQTWQQGLITGSTLTQANTIAGGSFDFVWNNLEKMEFNGDNTDDFNALNFANTYFIADNNAGVTVNQYMRTADGAKYAVTVNTTTQYEAGITIQTANPSSSTDTSFQISMFSSSTIPSFTYGTFPGTTGLWVKPSEVFIRLRNQYNSNLKILNLPSTTDTTWKPLAYNSADSTVKYVTSWPGGSTYTASNGITLTSSNFKLGGTLVNATSIDANGNNFEITNSPLIELSGASGGNVNLAVTNGSDIGVSTSINLNPRLGDLYIDSLDYTLSTTGKKIMLRDTASGLVENIDPALLSGAPGGSTKQIQYNNAGAFGGSGNMTQETGQILISSTSSTNPFVVKGHEDNAQGSITEWQEHSAAAVLVSINQDTTMSFRDFSGTVTTPAANFGKVYSRDDSLRFKNSAGTEFTLGSGGGSGDVTKVGTPANDQIGVWTGDGTIEGNNNLTWSGTSLGINSIGTISASCCGAMSISATSAISFTVGSGVYYPIQLKSAGAYFSNTGYIGDQTASAMIQISAGSATAGTAPLKFTVGSAALTTVAVDGQVEVLVDSIYYTGNNDTRNRLAYATEIGSQALKQGADVASVAGAIVLGSDGNTFEITGTNAITLISNVRWQNGSVVHLVFTSTATLTDGTANSGTDIGMELAGNANFTGSADDVVTLVLSEMGGTQRWREVSRSVN